jgi:DNA-binding NarL/FixJ family response regulator
MNGRSPTILLALASPSAQEAAAAFRAGKAALIAVDSLHAARTCTQGVALAGVVVELTLPDGCGLQLVQDLCGVDRGLPALVVGDRVDRALLERCQMLGADYLTTPVPHDNLQAFLARCLNRRDPVGAVARHYALSEREAELVRHLLDGRSLKQVPDAMAIRPSTVQTYTKRILRKTRLPSMADVVRVAYRQANHAGVDRRRVTEPEVHTASPAAPTFEL